MYKIMVNGIEKYSCRSFKEAERAAEKLKGKIYRVRYKRTRLPKAASLAYNSPASLKREMYREIYSENNHGYHFTKSRFCNG